jgi:hypothetical protein
MRMMTAPGMTFTNGSGPDGRQRQKEYEGSDQTVGRGVGEAFTEVGSDSRSSEAPAELFP